MTLRKTEEHIRKAVIIPVAQRRQRCCSGDRVIAVVRHGLSEGDQKERTSCKSRIHKVLSETAEEALRNKNGENTSEDRKIDRARRRQTEREKPAGDDRGSVFQGVRPFCDKIENKFRSARRRNAECHHQHRVEAEMPCGKNRHGDHADHDVAHDAECRQRTSEMRRGGYIEDRTFVLVHYFPPSFFA